MRVVPKEYGLQKMDGCGVTGGEGTIHAERYVVEGAACSINVDLGWERIKVRSTGVPPEDIG